MAKRYDPDARSPVGAQDLHEVPSGEANFRLPPKSIRLPRVQHTETKGAQYPVMSLLSYEDTRRLRAAAWRAVRKINPKAHVVWAAVKRRKEP